MFGKIKDKLKKIFGGGEEKEKEIEEEKVEIPQEAEKVEEIEEKTEEVTEKEIELEEEKIPEKKKEAEKVEEKKKEETPKKEKAKEAGKKIKTEEKEELVKEKEEVKEEKRGFFSKIFKKKEEEKKEEIVEEEKEKTETEKEIEEVKEERKSFISKVFEKVKSKKIDEDDFNKIWMEIEIFLLEINVAYEIVEKIEKHLRGDLVGKSFDRFKLSAKIREVMEEEVEKVLKMREANFLEQVRSFKERDSPVRILVLGVNGVGKTLSIAKIVNFLRKNDLSVVVASSDTFRAAAMEQLEQHSKKLNFKLIQHKGGSDPAAVAFDAIEHAKAKEIDVVLIDTAGRMPNNSNLMLELQKIKRVSKANMTVFVGDSVSGNDLIEQIELFNNGAVIDGLVLTKVDTDERPGSVVTAAYSVDKPIYFLGYGQGYDDLAVFDAKEIARKLFEVEE